MLTLFCNSITIVDLTSPVRPSSPVCRTTPALSEQDFEDVLYKQLDILGASRFKEIVAKVLDEHAEFADVLDPAGGFDDFPAWEPDLPINNYDREKSITPPALPGTAPDESATPVQADKPEQVPARTLNTIEETDERDLTPAIQAQAELGTPTVQQPISEMVLPEPAPTSIPVASTKGRKRKAVTSESVLQTVAPALRRSGRPPKASSKDVARSSG